MKILKLGSIGQEVRGLINLLIGKGYPVPVGDEFTDQVKRAVEDFQIKEKLVNAAGIPDGMVGPITMGKLKEGHPTQQAAVPSGERKLDAVSLERIKKAHPKVRAELLEIFKKVNSVLAGKAICRLAYVLRTFGEQSALYAQGRNGDKRPKVTNANAGYSIHNYGLAADIVLLKDTNGDGAFETASWETNVDFDGDGKADWMEVVDIFEAHGWKWGGRWTSFPDKPHFEKTYGKTASELLALHKANKFDGEGYVIF